MDIEITPITEEQFPRKARLSLPPIIKAIVALDVGTGFKTPCIWEHKRYAYLSGSTRCGGSAHCHQIAGRRNIRVRTACQDGIFHVLRVEDKA